jgi:radical SAM-linked protein
MKEVRIRFRKIGRAKYISHLDLTRTMTRALRRAGIPIWYTEGFNRHPYVTFASPLSLGFEGLCESMDIRLVQDMPMEELVAVLNSAMPEGLEVYAADQPVMKAREIAFARYRLTFTGDIEKIPDFLAQDSIIAEKRSKKGVVRQIDLKTYLEKSDIHIDSEKTELEITLPCSSSETVNPMLIAAAYSDYVFKNNTKKAFCDVSRLDLMNSQGCSFK